MRPPDVVDRVELLVVELGFDRLAVRVEHPLDVVVIVLVALAVLVLVVELGDQELVIVELAFLEDRAVAVEGVGVDVAQERVRREVQAVGHLVGGSRVSCVSLFSVMSGWVKTALRLSSSSSTGEAPLPRRFVSAWRDAEVHVLSPSR